MAQQATQGAQQESKSLGAHVGGRAYTIWLDSTGQPVRVTSCGNRVQQLPLQSRVARAAIARATGAEA
jgi:hypothetical protein